MSVAEDAVFLSMPATVKDADGYPTATSIGFVVTKDLVATVRFEHLPSFERLAERIAHEGALSPSGLAPPSLSWKSSSTNSPTLSNAPAATSMRCPDACSPLIACSAVVPAVWFKVKGWW